MQVDTTRNDDTFVISLNSPENLNAQTPSLWEDLTEIVRGIDPDIRFLLMRGEGKAFSAGLDRAMFTADGSQGEPSFMDLASKNEEDIDSIIAHYQQGFRVFRDAPQISIAQVQGYAIGAGFQLALACDFIVATPDAQFALKETSLGLVPDLGGAGALAQRVGYSRALEISASGRFVSAQEAYDLGIVTLVSDDLDAGASTLIDSMRPSLPQALIDTKGLYRSIAYGEEPWLAERRAQTLRLKHLLSLAAGS